MYFDHISLIFLEWEFFQTKFVDKIKTNILFTVRIFFLIIALYEMTWKNTVQPEAIDDYTEHVHCILDTWGYKYTISLNVIHIDFPLQKWQQ